MVRTQVQLTEKQHRELTRWARSVGISLAEAVRRCVEEHLAAEAARPDRDALVREARAAYGRYADADGSAPAAEDHDAHLAKAYRR